MYRKRIERGGWKEEVWYSYYQIYMKTRQMRDLWDGVECYQNRIENIYNHFKWKRENSKGYTQEDYAIGHLGYQIYKNFRQDGGQLFLDEDVYKWRYLDEYSLVCFYTNHKEEGKVIMQELLNKLDVVDDGNKERLRNNAKYFGINP
jgi:hypothetical protein